ncbi:MAG: hypothetical protein KAJ18_08475 [Candidatus Omnitrophica bacterium]|nr:hypothetical protein [Candidatus Omnitrophota bacterium]
MKKVFLFIACLFVVWTLVGCETFKGIAKDVENTGKNIGGFLSGEK